MYLRICGKIHNPSNSMGFKKPKNRKLNKIAISQIRILSGGDTKELEVKGDYQ